MSLTAPEKQAPSTNVLASPAPVRLTPEMLIEENRRNDRLLVGVLVLLAFLLASFPIAHSDMWMSLRTGQLIDRGEFVFGTDPYCFTTSGQRWIHPGWLSDWLFYCIHSWFGGGGLVLLRGLLMLGTTLVMLRFRRDGGSSFAPVLCIGLAVFAMAPYLSMRSEMFSVFFLALTLYLLWRPAVAEPGRSRLAPLRWTHGRFYFLLPVLFALWANLDEWFVLGLLLLGLWNVGAWMQSRWAIGQPYDRTTPEERRCLWIIFALCAAACLLNPYHFWVFHMPSEMLSPAYVFMGDKFRTWHITVSPFESSYFRRLGVFSDILQPFGLTLTEWAYFPLVLLGVCLVPSRGLFSHWTRVILWLVFFALSGWQARNIAFFAVVAGPLTALNLQDLMAKAAPQPSLRRWSVAVSQFSRFFLLALFLIAIVFIAVPYPEPTTPYVFNPLIGQPTLGWINPRGSLGWSLHVDASMRGVAEHLHRWRVGKVVPEESLRAFPMNWMDQPAYDAWFNPGGKSFIDARYPLHEETAQDFYQAYEALRDTGRNADPTRPMPPQEVDAWAERWQSIFKKYDLSMMILGERNVPRPDPRQPMGTRLVSLRAILLDMRDRQGKHFFEILDYFDGQNFLLAWTGSKHFERLQEHLFNPYQAAFRKGFPAPPPISEPPTTDQDSPLTVWLKGSLPNRPPGVDAAANILQRFAEVRSLLRQQYLMNAHGEFVDHLLQYGGNLAAGQWRPPIIKNITPLVPGEFFLAIRYAREAIAASQQMNDVRSQMARGEAYRQLALAYENLYEMEKGICEGMLNPVREVQVTSAYHQAVQLLPGDPSLHFNLARRYLGRRDQTGRPEPLLDVGLYHFEMAVQLRARLAGPGEQDKKIQDAEIVLKRDLFNVTGLQYEELNKGLKLNQERYKGTVRRDPLKPSDNALRRFDMAFELRLLRQAEEALNDALSGPKVDEEVYLRAIILAISLGDLPRLMHWMGLPIVRQKIGEPRYIGFAAVMAPAIGAYDQATEYRKELAKIIEQDAARNLLSVGRLHTLGGSFDPVGSNLWGFQRGMFEQFNIMHQLSEQWIMMGLNHLEAGRPAEAARLFRHAIKDIQPLSPYRNLAGRYYYLITGQFLED